MTIHTWEVTFKFRKTTSSDGEIAIMVAGSDQDGKARPLSKVVDLGLAILKQDYKVVESEIRGLSFTPEVETY